MNDLDQYQSLVESVDIDEAEAQADVDLEQEYRDTEWLSLALNAFRTSSDFMESSLKRQWERNTAHFRSRHAPGSKYFGDSYKHRSKVFRPKTRSTLRRHEAAAAMAYFSTPDSVHITPENESDPQQIISAEINKELLNYRLDKDANWFFMLIGAYQEAMTIGVVTSYQHWEYKEKIIQHEVPATGQQGEPIINENGEVESQIIEQRQVIKDKLSIELRPPENIRIDPASDWTDPVNSSPYLIDIIPMYVYEVKAKMEEGGNGDQPSWRYYDDGVITSAIKQEYDSLRKQREGSQRQDSKTQSSGNAITEYTLVWVHRNFIRKDDQDYMFYTLGVEHMLSDPKPIEEIYHQSERPYVMGSCLIEAHRTHPSGLAELGEQTQNETNEIANARIDNIKLAINKRFYVRRGANVDFQNLMRSVPGSGILMDDINGDVKEERTTDVTASSYQEQDRLNLDFDDVMGAFSPSSIQSNRKMNETVGGMEMLSGEANAMAEYQLRVFNESWVEPVLRQCLTLIQNYETDETVLMIAGQKARLEKKYNIQNIDWRTLQGPMNLRVSVGFGATNPRKRIEDISIGLRTIGEFLPQAIQGLDTEEIIAEVFGALGHEDGKRFFKILQDDEEQNPEVMQLQQQLQEMQKIIDTKQIQQQGRLAIEQMKQQGSTQREQMKTELQISIKQAENQLAAMDVQIAAEQNALARSELILQQEVLTHKKRLDEIQLLQQERSYSDNKIDLMDDSKAGVLSRNQYGKIPFAEG